MGEWFIVCRSLSNICGYGQFHDGWVVYLTFFLFLVEREGGLCLLVDGGSELNLNAEWMIFCLGLLHGVEA